MDIKNFIERNNGTYNKYKNISENTISKYISLFKGRFPEELIWIWRNMGAGVFEDGYLQIVDPEEYDFAFDYIDKLLEPCIIWGITALGDSCCGRVMIIGLSLLMKETVQPSSILETFKKVC